MAQVRTAPPGPTFRCTADEPPQAKGLMFGALRSFDSRPGLILDEFVFEDLVHVEQMDDDSYYARVGRHVFYLTRKRGKWTARLHEIEAPVGKRRVAGGGKT